MGKLEDTLKKWQKRGMGDYGDELPPRLRKEMAERAARNGEPVSPSVDLPAATGLASGDGTNSIPSVEPLQPQVVSPVQGEAGRMPSMDGRNDGKGPEESGEENSTFYVAAVFNPTPKNDLGSMEHPLFSLSTKRDTQVRHYEHQGNTVTVVPSGLGSATIWDKDILIYSISQLMDALSRNCPISRTIRVRACDLLVATHRETGGANYSRLKDALNRLRGTTINTNIKTNGVRIRKGFGLIESWESVSRDMEDERMSAIDITLSEWLYNAVLGGEVLAVSREYFKLRKGLERRLYELARKNCINDVVWEVSLQLLHDKTGSTTNMRDFRRQIRSIARSDHLP
ncbi:MAG: replication initiator protein A, partial [Candidatus Competibacteraceae bacterium]|nr:replication initiator protein A [Candidatus Competibacteraceae bacterium]